MKTILLSISIGFCFFGAKAQAVFNVKSPLNIAGNYDFTWADPAGGWGTPDFNIQGTFVEDTAMLVDDGSTGTNDQGNPISAEGCNPLINNLTGKIAVIYRNTCEFGAKALNAQNAGAVGVIIINRDADVIAMGSGADGANVTIPVAFVSNSTGALIVNAMLNQSVVVFMGNKVGFFDNDLGMNKPDIFIPNPNTNHSLISQNASEYSVRVGAFVNNFGVNNQTDAIFNAVISYNGSQIYSESQTFSLASLENTSIELPTFSQATYPIGKYTITYTITGSVADEYDSDNTYTTDFFISDQVFSYAKLDSTGVPIAASGFRPSAVTSRFESCIHFRNENANRLKAKGLYFSAYNTLQQFDGRLVEVICYKWNDQFIDVNDTVNATFNNLEQVAFADYSYTTDSMNLKTVYAPFNLEVALVNDQRYLFCIATYEEDMYLGFSNLDYSLVYANTLQPLFPINSDQYYLAGFGPDAAPSIGVDMADALSAIGENTQASLNVYPNPAKDKITISGDDLVQFETIEVKDQLGRTIYTAKVNSTSSTIETSKFANGNYLLVLNGTRGVEVRNIQINH